MSCKFIYDSIHKQIPVHQTTLNIINTYPFQRLRYLKQLSVTEYVFPTAHHTRFEHCIGVSYLAGKMLRCIKNKQPELEITEDDILKVEIAGLCHDLGHGPYSHTFDKFLSTLNCSPKIITKHEERSCLILDYLVYKYHINITPSMLNDIKDLISPTGSSNQNKPFLYHIIANSLNGIDVDKFDYLKRDSYNLGIPYGIDLERLIETARVIDNEICYPDKMISSISNIFELRGRLHKEIYTHPVVYAVELMVLDMLRSMEMDWGKFLSDPELFLTLTDNIINYIPENNTEAIAIRQQIWERQLYKYIEHIQIPKELHHQIDDIITEFYTNNSLIKDDVIITPIYIGYPNNPVEKVKFYNSKKDVNKSFAVDTKHMSPLLPQNFEELTVRFYIKDKSMRSLGYFYLTQFHNMVDEKIKKIGH